MAGQILGSLHAWDNRGSLEIRYAWGTEVQGNRLRVILVGRAAGWTPEQAAFEARLILNSAIGQFPPDYKFAASTSGFAHAPSAWTEIERFEEIRTPSPFAHTGFNYYYLFHPLGGDSSRWPELPAHLLRKSNPGFLSINIMPTHLSGIERESVDEAKTMMALFAKGRTEPDYFGMQRQIPPDEAASDAYKAWNSVSSTNGFLVRIGIASRIEELPGTVSAIGAMLTATSSQDSGRLPTRFKAVPVENEWDRFQSANLGLISPRYSHEVWKLERPPFSLQRQSYFFSLEEAAGLLVLPVPDRQGVPGVPLTSRLSGRREQVVPNNHGAQVDSLILGRALHEGREAGTVRIPLESLKRHTLTVGSTGSGKTTTVLSMLVQLWRDHRIPFLVIESALTEYRSLLEVDGLDELRVITIGHDSVSPLRLNPLAPPPDIRCEVHKGSVLAAIKMALPLGEPLPQILETALHNVYLQFGWNDDDTIAMGLPVPTLRDLLVAFKSAFVELGYRYEASNVGPAFEARIGSLLVGSKGRLLDTVESSDFQKLLAYPVVIELDEVRDPQEKALIAALILGQVRSAADTRTRNKGKPKHITVIEEAHRILPNRTPAATSEAGDKLTVATVQAFCEAIAELRTKGEAFIISSQSPADLVDAAIANTATRVVHQLTSGLDRDRMLTDMDADDELKSIVLRLKPGQGVFRSPDHEEVEVLAVNDLAGVSGEEDLSTEYVRDAMAEHREQTAQLLPYRLCSPSVCTSGCIGQTRSSGLRAATEIGLQAREDWNEARVGGSVTKVASRTVEVAGGDLISAYCTAVHLSIAGNAFLTSPDRDERKWLADVLRQAADENA